jgi:hypothetical protein
MPTCPVVGIEWVDPRGGIYRVLTAKPGASNKNELDNWIERHASAAQGNKQQA